MKVDNFWIWSYTAAYVCMHFYPDQPFLCFFCFLLWKKLYIIQYLLLFLVPFESAVPFNDQKFSNQPNLGNSIIKKPELFSLNFYYYSLLIYEGSVLMWFGSWTVQ